MARLRYLFFVGLSLQCTTGLSQTAITYDVVAKRTLWGLSAAEADALIAKVKEAQRRLKSGEFVRFELLAGSIASNKVTRVTPRNAFLKLPLDKIVEIKRGSTDNRLWQPYRLAYAPKGSGRFYWDIEVVLGFNGNIERIQMLYKPRAPS